MNWDGAIKAVRPHVVKIATPGGFGTGFLAFYNHDASWCGVATAAHVVSHADDWQQPIRIHSEETNTFRFLKDPTERVIFVDRATDSAVVLFVKGDLELPQVPITLLPLDKPCGIGIDVGWLGYPGIEPNTLCFFAGTVSARQSSHKAYLIDGVAINGVSGGPVFHLLKVLESGATGAIKFNRTVLKPQIIGCVSAYHANRATGETLPGLLRAQDVSHFHAVASTVRSLDEANAKKREFDAAQNQNVNEGATDDAAEAEVEGEP
jgi:Trypsin-like peptidase domain